MVDITFPAYSGARCLMMPYIQGVPESVPEHYRAYRKILADVFVRKGDVGFLTIDESPVKAGSPHRGKRAKFGRALHTEAGRKPGTKLHCWGGGTWGDNVNVTLDPDVRILLASNTNDSTAIWDAEHRDTSADGDIGDAADLYPYETATTLRAGEVREIGIFTPHESLPVKQDGTRQFLRIVSAGVHGREPYFTQNPLMVKHG